MDTGMQDFCTRRRHICRIQLRIGELRADVLLITFFVTVQAGWDQIPA